MIVAVGSPVHRQKQERARRCCLECVLYELDQMGVTQVWLESRAPSQDRRDRRLVDSARDKGLVSHGLVLDFAGPHQEPMLWLPDAVAGAVTAANLGEPRWLLALSEVTDIHRHLGPIKRESWAPPSGGNPSFTSLQGALGVRSCI